METHARTGDTVRRIVGGRVPIDGELTRADVVIGAGRIEAVITDPEPPSGGSGTAAREDGTATVDASGAVVAPGFIDLQCNGAAGHDLTADIIDDAVVVDRVARALPRYGVTAFLPTVVTSPRPVRAAAIDAMRERTAPGTRSADEENVGASALGLHFEGPLVSVLGAHSARYVGRPGSDEIASWIDSGVVSLVTLAPEAEGALDVVRMLTDHGVVVSAGHTEMSAETLAEARSAGLSYVTHLFNAMAPFAHRRPGPVGAVLADDGVVAGLVCDGLHVDPVTVRMAWRALGPHRTSLVSDATAALGTPHGRFRLGALDVVHDDRGVRTVDGTLAGSALGLDRAVRNLVAFAGCSLTDALATVTTTPADLLGLTDRGRIAVGNHADVTIVDPEGHLLSTIIGGRIAWRS